MNHIFQLWTTSPNNTLTKMYNVLENSIELIENLISASVINDNFYAFSFNKTLIETPLDQLKNITNVRFKYLQVDTLNKCIPQDWFLGYDQFSVYSFINLQKMFGNNNITQRQLGGHLNTYFRPARAWSFNFINNKNRFTIDYKTDFDRLSPFKCSDYINIAEHTCFTIGFLYNRFMIFVRCLFDMCLLSAANYWITRWARHLIFEMGNHSDNKMHINWQSLV